MNLPDDLDRMIHGLFSKRKSLRAFTRSLENFLRSYDEGRRAEVRTLRARVRKLRKWIEDHAYPRNSCHRKGRQCQVGCNICTILYARCRGAGRRTA